MRFLALLLTQKSSVIVSGHTFRALVSCQSFVTKWKCLMIKESQVRRPVPAFPVTTALEFPCLGNKEVILNYH